MGPEYNVVRWDNPLPPSANSLRKTMINDGYTVFSWSDPPETKYGRHAHDTEQSHWIVSVVLELEVQGIGRVTLYPGDRDFMPANTYHSAKVIGDEPVVYLIGEKA